MYTPKKRGSPKRTPINLFSKGLFFQAKLGENLVEHARKGFHEAASDNPDSDIE